MGEDLKFQAIPEDAEILIAARSGEFDASDLPFFASTIRRGRLPDDHPHAYFVNPKWDLANRTLERYPNLDKREMSLGRHWDMVYYLLSERRRASSDSRWSGERTFAEYAIFGADEIYPGSKVNYLGAQVTREVANWLSTIDVPSLRPYVNVQAMIDVDVYKSWQLPAENDKAWERLRQDFEQVRDFYVIVANHNEGMISHIF